MKRNLQQNLIYNKIKKFYNKIKKILFILCIHHFVYLIILYISHHFAYHFVNFNPIVLYIYPQMLFMKYCQSSPPDVDVIRRNVVGVRGFLIKKNPTLVSHRSTVTNTTRKKSLDI